MKEKMKTRDLLKKRDHPNILFLIQARMGSTRLPGKVLHPLAGKPMLERLIDRLNLLNEFGKIIIATTKSNEDNQIVNFAEKKNIFCFRGDEDDALSRFIGASIQFDGNIIIRITGDNPLTDPDIAIEAINYMLTNNLEYVGVKGLPLGIASEAVTLEALKKCLALTEDPIHRENITSFIYTNHKLFDFAFIDKSKSSISRPSLRLTVDTKEDMLLMEQIFSILGDFPALMDVINLLDKRPDIRELNANIVQRTLQERVR